MTKTKKVIAGTGIALLTTTAGSLGYFLKNNHDEKKPIVEIITQIETKDYETIKSELLKKIDNKEPLTIDEYKWLVAIYDIEIKKEGGLKYNNFKGNKDTLFQNITNDIK